MPTTPPSITPVPTPAPDRSDRSTFSGRVDGFVTWITSAVAEFSAVATNTFDNATEANADAVATAADLVATQAEVVNAQNEVVNAQAEVVNAQNEVALATTQANNAAASAAASQSAIATTTTSSTQLTISLGSKSLTVGTALPISLGVSVVIAETASPFNSMHGTVTSYTTGTGAMIVQVVKIQGEGVNKTAWTVSTEGIAGVDGQNPDIYFTQIGII